jgi:hypothetical protein
MQSAPLLFLHQICHSERSNSARNASGMRSRGTCFLRDPSGTAGPSTRDWIGVPIQSLGRDDSVLVDSSTYKQEQLHAFEISTLRSRSAADCY